MEVKEVFEPIIRFIKGLQKKERENSKVAAKERLKLVLMQDRASVSPDFFEMMKKEIIEVIKKYIEIDEEALEVQLTRGFEDGLEGPALYANIPIKSIKPVAKKVKEDDNHNENVNKESEKSKTNETKEENKKTVSDEKTSSEEKNNVKNVSNVHNNKENKIQNNKNIEKVKKPEEKNQSEVKTEKKHTGTNNSNNNKSASNYSKKSKSTSKKKNNNNRAKSKKK